MKIEPVNYRSVANKIKDLEEAKSALKEIIGMIEQKVEADINKNIKNKFYEPLTLDFSYNIRNASWSNEAKAIMLNSLEHGMKVNKEDYAKIELSYVKRNAKKIDFFKKLNEMIESYEEERKLFNQRRRKHRRLERSVAKAILEKSSFKSKEENGVIKKLNDEQTNFLEEIGYEIKKMKDEKSLIKFKLNKDY